MYKSSGQYAEMLSLDRLIRRQAPALPPAVSGLSSEVLLSASLHDSQEFGWALFARSVVTEGLSAIERAIFPAEALHPGKVSACGQVEFSKRGPNGESTVLRLGRRRLAFVQVRFGDGHLFVAADDSGKALKEAQRLARRLRSPRAFDGDRLTVTVWNADGNAFRPCVTAPRWSELADNYIESTSTQIDALMGATDCDQGRLLVWHGPAGTGKTYAARALARAWRGWCELHVIADPHLLLGVEAPVLYEALAREERATLREATGRGEAVDRPWQLVLIEDGPGLVARDASMWSEEMLSRLLNLTDGLLGESARVIVLVTTSEELHLHSAIQRPGRCWAKVEFKPLSAAEANRWLSRHGSDKQVRQSTTLADLYALRRGAQPASSDQQVGFVS